MRIIPIASGKGGVGKSLTAANLSIALAEKGMRTVLADMDLGASNLHLVIGHRKAGKSMGAFLSGGSFPFSDLAAETDYRGLRFIPGDAEIPGVATLGLTDRKKIIKGLKSLAPSTDILVLDLGAGAHQSILDFFLLSGRGIVVSAPAVTAILGAYVFLKNAVFRLMYNSFKKGSAAYGYLESLKKTENALKMLYIPRMLDEVAQIDSASVGAFRESLAKFCPRIVINMMADPKDADAALKIRRSCETYLGLSVEQLGILYRDSVQETALASRIPVLVYKPHALISQGLTRIADKILLENEDEDGAPINEENIDSGYEAAAMEAESDFEARMDYVEELLHSGTLSQGDLIETVKTQSLEISKLRKENNLLKSKLLRASEEGFKL